MHDALSKVAAPRRDLFQNHSGEQGNSLLRQSRNERTAIMSRRTIFSVTASIFVGIACTAMISTDALAYRGGGGRAGVGRAGVHHAGVHHGGVYRGAAVRRGVAVGVGAAAVGAAAYGAAAYCGYQPYPPCY